MGFLSTLNDLERRNERRPALSLRQLSFSLIHVANWEWEVRGELHVTPGWMSHALSSKRGRT